MELAEKILDSKESTKYHAFNNMDNTSDIIDSLDYDKLNFIYLKSQKYTPAWNFQKKLHVLNIEKNIPDVVIFLEHSNVYTFGKNADKNFLLNIPPNAEVVQTDRGGQVTYHGPGQLVGYPIINLNNYKKSITWFMRSLEQVIIDSLKKISIRSHRKDDLPGVWVEDDKICAMGVRISRWVTMHGFALNVNPDMKFFDMMIPCGIQNLGVTSIYEQINEKINNQKLINIICNQFDKIFNKDEI